MMRDYHRWMGGVDVHDQLRLQRYSLQQQTKCKKYYKAVFLGLVDIAIVNAYVVYRDVQKARGAKQDTHAQFLMQLQAQMLDVTEDDFAEVRYVQHACGCHLQHADIQHVYFCCFSVNPKSMEQESFLGRCQTSTYLARTWTFRS